MDYAVALGKCGNFVGQERAILRGMAIFQELGVPSGTFNLSNFSRLGECLEQQGRVEEAEEIFKKGISCLEAEIKSSNRHNLWLHKDVIKSYGTLLARQKRFKEAESIQLRALRIAETEKYDEDLEHHRIKTVFDVVLMLSETYRLMGSEEKIEPYMTKYAKKYGAQWSDEQELRHLIDHKHR